MDDEQRRQIDEVGDQGEIPERIERQIRVDRGVDGVGADGVDEQRVRVALLLGDELAGDVAGGARALSTAFGCSTSRACSRATSSPRS
jgi:hypothetical protein